MPERLSRGEDEHERRPLFALGRTLATPGALHACEEAEVLPQLLFMRHQSGDWGDLVQEDREANDHALEHGGRLFSAYNLPTDQRLWVITESDRSATTLLKPEEY